MADVLPDWLIIGAPKCGTTSVAGWIKQHPQGFVSSTKELSFFDVHWKRGIPWYAEHFRDRQPGQLAGEATPVYIYSDQALDRIAETLPDVRIILLLREPISRVWSQSWFLRTIGVDPRPLSRAIASHRKTGEPGFRLPVGYIESSHYAARVRALLDRFPAEQILLEFNENLITEPTEFWSRICHHIGIDPDAWSPDLSRIANPGRAPRSTYLQWVTTLAHRRGIPRRPLDRVRKLNAGTKPYPKIPEELRRSLRLEFANEIPELEQLLGRKLPEKWYSA